MNYKTHTIYAKAEYHNFDIYPTISGLYLVQGDAVAPQSMVQTCTLQSTKDIEALQERAPLSMFAVECYDQSAENGILLSHWFETEEELRASKSGADMLANGGKVITSELWPQRLFPISLPTTVVLEEGKRGLYARMNLRPDLDGNNGRGKFYFPDRSSSDICCGPFEVTSVTDRGNYGFIKGHMVKTSAPSESALAEYLANDLSRYANGTLHFMHHPLLGSYVRVDYSETRPNIYHLTWSARKTSEYLVMDEDGSVSSQPHMEYYPWEESEQCQVRDFLCQGYQGCSYDDAAKKFLGVNFIRFDDTESPKFISSLFDEACEMGFFSLRKGITEFVRVNFDMLLTAAVDFSEEEFAQLIEECNRINTAANERYRSLVKQGRIKLT